MSTPCKNCPEPMPWERDEQYVDHFRAWLADGSVILGTSPDDFRSIPDWPTAVIGVTLYFNDGTKRVVWDSHWTYMVEYPDGHWTIDGDDDANVLLLKYPKAIFKPSALVSDALMQRVTREMME